MTRMNRAVLAAFLCSATAPAAMCDPTEQMSPFNGAQWTTLSDSGSEIQRTAAAPNNLTQEVMQLPDATVVLLERLAADKRPEATTVDAQGLPSTSTAPEHEPESGLR